MAVYVSRYQDEFRHKREMQHAQLVYSPGLCKHRFARENLFIVTSAISQNNSETRIPDTIVKAEKVTKNSQASC